MNLLNKFSGKNVENKVEEYSEVYGEILLGLHKELEKQGALLEQQEQHFNSQVENLHGQVKDVGSSLKKLEDRSEQNHSQITGELEKQGALLEQQEQHFNSQVENLHGQVKDVGSSLKKLEDRSEQNHSQITGEFKSFRSVIEQYRLEASTIEDIKNSLSQVVRKSDQQNKHIQLLRIVCVFSYVFAIGVGVIIWMIS
ncbi:MAG: hypothetical protein OXH16_01625 [Gemmatimonadetes bacterium]|nr:hypothetical protein [Gemmatimonadota bacterium]